MNRPLGGETTLVPTIELEKVRLRALSLSDVEALAAHLREPLVTQLTSYPEITAAFAEAMIAKSLTRWAAGEPSRWALTLPDDRLIGTVGFSEWSSSHQWAELSYDLSPNYWGQGLMSQAVMAAIEWAFQSGLVERIHAFVRVDNLRSGRLLERCGFVREGCLRGYRICRAVRHDFELYGLLKRSSVS